jgi:hypothetical protein
MSPNKEMLAFSQHMTFHLGPQLGTSYYLVNDLSQKWTSELLSYSFSINLAHSKILLKL